MIKLIVNFCSSSFAVPIDDSMSEFNVLTDVRLVITEGSFFRHLIALVLTAERKYKMLSL